MAINDVSTGIPGLDIILEGGFIKGDTYVISGDIGAGKTIFSLQYLSHAPTEKTVSIFISLKERKKHLMRVLNSFGWHSGHIDFVEIFPRPYTTHASRSPDEIMAEIIDRVSKKKGESDDLRVAIDPINPIFSGLDEEKRRDYLLSLIELLEEQGATSILVSENDREENTVEGHVARGYIRLFHEAGKKRHLTVIKMGGKQYKAGNYYIDIKPEKGMDIIWDFRIK